MSAKGVKMTHNFASKSVRHNRHYKTIPNLYPKDQNKINIICTNINNIMVDFLITINNQY